jgi:SNF2 family DNA or RNA helicase
MRQPVVRMAICDDVGIGKTIESGLIAVELLGQGDADGLAVLCSPALAEQWQDELRGKFGIDAELVLASTVPRLERGLAYGQSLFDRHRHMSRATDEQSSPYRSTIRSVIAWLISSSCSRATARIASQNRR